MTEVFFLNVETKRRKQDFVEFIVTLMVKEFSKYLKRII